MRYFIRFVSLVTVCCAATIPHQAHAQTLDPLPGLYVAVPATFSTFDATLMQGGSKKSPALAGILSWLVFPGVGSYYAGNSGHGTRHLLLGLGTLTVTIVGLAMAVDDIQDDLTIDEGSVTLMLVGLLGYGVNAIWSIVTAVTDASHHNAGIASLIQPGVRILTSSSGMAPMMPTVDRRVGLQLVRVSF